ncbi:energy-coupling factor ABC transporter ATP-binding protein [Bacillus lacus]|uniref:Energy-coupling factor transporter ATP-binding protein EcfA2 n=1 Tax=Metabacillus lacus TaxID=1983721 RepID=A0A7X2M084_9BACI|nr:energy-coupling factor ABC transporter ATP-binding protein [Metabacillus lacus]MRX72514.1 energy-coupling factor ABC transporter ATP-binding protein [Metabacillus lacus]
MDITLKELEHRYQIRSPFERLALHNINLTIKEGTYLAIIGHTGSGKSTVLQHLNALLRPTKGSIVIGDTEIEAGRKYKNLKSIRKKVAIVFQFPEHQLFEETVEKDIAFGPLNFGVSEQEAKQKARQALSKVGLSEELLTRSPFDLSGGQMRRAAIAGVLAMEPEVLVLDEPTAGLDPHGRHEIMEMFADLHRQQGLTTILVTHSMEDAARYADQIVVMEGGTIKMEGTPRDIFKQSQALAEMGLDLPETIKLKSKLEDKLGQSIGAIPLTMEESIAQIKNLLGRGGKDAQ